MSFQIDTFLVNQYRDNIVAQYQQKGSRLRDTVMVEPQHAEFEYFDRVTPTAAVLVTNRHSDTPLISTGADRRQSRIQPYDWADLIDDYDKLRMLADPTSVYVQNAVYSLGRAMDDAIIAAFNGTMFGGKSGATSITQLAASLVALNYDPVTPANSNLTINKLIQARRLLDQAEANAGDQPMFAIVTASHLAALLRTIQITNSQYNTVQALVQGMVDTFMGFKFIRTQRAVQTGNNRSAFFYPKDGVMLALAEDIIVSVDRLPMKRNSTQVYVCAKFGSTRMWEEKVIEVTCDETL